MLIEKIIFEKINKMNKPVNRLTKKKRREKLTISRMKQCHELQITKV
jgi:hypothetical protein